MDVLFLTVFVRKTKTYTVDFEVIIITILLNNKSNLFFIKMWKTVTIIIWNHLY